MILVLLDTNTYLRLAKRIRPLLGIKFGTKEYVLTVLDEVEKEVRASNFLQFKYPWFDDVQFETERCAKKIRLSKNEKQSIDNIVSIFQAHLNENIEIYLDKGRSPPGKTDCKVLALGQIRSAVVVTDDLGMHLLAFEFKLTVWHGWELLKKMRTAKFIDNNLIREIYKALETNSDLTNTWKKAKHTAFEKIFGKNSV